MRMSRPYVCGRRKLREGRLPARSPPRAPVVSLTASRPGWTDYYDATVEDKCSVREWCVVCGVWCVVCAFPATDANNGPGHLVGKRMFAVAGNGSNPTMMAG